MTACCMVVLFLAAWAGEPVTAPGATRVHDVLTELQKPKTSKKAERWCLKEQDVNQFVDVALASRKRIGLRRLRFEFDQSGALAATAVVNMDDIKLQGLAARAFKTMLSGTHTLKTRGRFLVKDSKGVFKIDKASFDDVWAPAWFASSVVAFAARKQPPHIDITEEFAMPYGITSVRITKGQAEIVR